MRKTLFSGIAACLLATAATAAEQSPSVIWTVGQADRSASEFALAPDRFRDFLANDFGYEDKYFLVGHSVPAADFPYVLPGPADTWGGTMAHVGLAHASGQYPLRTERDSLRRNLHARRRSARLRQKLPAAGQGFGQYAGRQVPARRSGLCVADQRKPNQMEKIVDTLSITATSPKRRPAGSKSRSVPAYSRPAATR